MGSYDAISMFSARVTPGMTERIHGLLDVHGDRLRAYTSLLLSHNKAVNLISRQFTEDAFRRHTVHCVAFLARSFPSSARVVDWGTGGGLPAVPLAIAEPDVEIIAVDSIGKKVRVLQRISEEMYLQNVSVWRGRAEEFDQKCDYSVSRATAPLATLWSWHKRSRNTDSQPVEGDFWQPGLLCLKGGDLEAEIGALLDFDSDVCVDLYSVAHLVDDAYFDGKSLIHVY